LIWCGSLLTHLDAEGWRGFLTLFQERLSSSGVLVFTTRGRLLAEEMRSARRAFALQHSGRSLLADYDQAGFGFEVFRRSPDVRYGISLSSPAWVCRELERYPALSLVAYIESAWDRRLDVVGLTQRAPTHQRA
jgi:hypothetical protein